MVTRSSNSSNQERKLDQFCSQPLDLLVVGGGIVGAGVARDAALRGLRVGLIEQHDFASGTSSRSSRLLHGGLRYVAQARIGLVWEASREKKIVRDIAPHLAQSLPFIFPTRKGTEWTRGKLAIGVKVYDLLCGLRNFGKSSSMGRDAVLQMLPELAQKNLTGAVRYFDALTSDSRLVIDTLRSASEAGGLISNYVELLDANPEQGRWRCDVQDKLTGQMHCVVARSMVNATGPWSDRLPNSRTSLRLTKGVHLVVDRQRFPVPEAVVMAEGSRILFAIPWGDRVILGTTDTDYSGPLSEPPCDEEDIRYVLAVVNAEFPEAKLDKSDVISTWSGLRPLVADPNGNPSDISRRHKIEMSSAGWWDVTGGKLTTYRLMAEETVDEVVKYLGAKASDCRTAELPLLPEERVRGVSGILPPTVSESIVHHFCRNEWARHLDDVMIRRSSWRHYHRDQFEIAERVSRWMSSALGWDHIELESEMARYRQLIGGSSLPKAHTNMNGAGAERRDSGVPGAPHAGVERPRNVVG